MDSAVWAALWLSTHEAQYARMSSSHSGVPPASRQGGRW